MKLLNTMREEHWPELRFEHWQDTCETLHRWTQIVGKIRLSKSPWANHSWNSTLYVTEKGLTTSVIHDREVSFAIDFDFISHLLVFSRSDGRQMIFPLAPESVATFYEQCLTALDEMGCTAKIVGRPNELLDALPFAEDRLHSEYERECAHQFWRILLESDRVMKEFRSRFSGKVSPVHFFWGSFDLAVTRFSGRPAPEHPGGVPHLPDLVAREAYSDEVSSCGFWPGNAQFPTAAFYSYAYPKPVGFESARVPRGAYYEAKLREFVLPYEAVKRSDAPDELVLDFFQRTYEAAAILGHWDRQKLEGSRYLRELQAQANARRTGRRAA